MTKQQALALLKKTRAYVAREASSPTINLLDPPRSRENAAMLRLVDLALARPRYRRTMGTEEGP